MVAVERSFHLPQNMSAVVLLLHLSQLSVLPQVHDGQLLCLPALEVWGTLLDPEVGPCASSSSNSTGAAAAAAGSSAAPGKVLLERAHSEGDSAGAV
jgi:hypothetical protein